MHSFFRAHCAALLVFSYSAISVATSTAQIINTACTLTGNLLIPGSSLHPSDQVSVEEGVLAYIDHSRDAISIRQAGPDGLFGTNDDHTAMMQQPSKAEHFVVVLNKKTIIYSNSDSTPAVGELRSIRAGADSLFGTSDDMNILLLRSLGRIEAKMSNSGVLLALNPGGNQVLYCDSLKPTGVGSCTVGNIFASPSAGMPVAFRSGKSIGFIGEWAGGFVSAIDGLLHRPLDLSIPDNYSMVDVLGSQLLVKHFENQFLLEENELFTISLPQFFAKLPLHYEPLVRDDLPSSWSTARHSSVISQLVFNNDSSTPTRYRVMSTSFGIDLPDSPFGATDYEGLSTSITSGPEIFGVTGRRNNGRALTEFLQGFYCN